VAQKISVDQLLEARNHLNRLANAKVEVATRLEFDSESSTHSTLLQVVAQDVPGLLRQIALAFNRHQCNIEVALIDTEGEIAIDVFYLTIGGAKLNQDIQQQLHTALSLAVEELRPAPAGT
jgi:[protein-PII] uridylyltransferase